MYARQPPDGRIPRNMRIPRNYSGNAFRQEPEVSPFSPEEQQDAPPDTLPEPSQEPVPQERSADTPQESPQEDAPAGKLFPSPGFKLELGRLFGKDRNGGIGFEDLLILGLIVLVTQSDTKDDLAFLLLLLLFIH
ncbi:MAG: hypothetical protein IJW44_04745 [Clostridia bacterium]|nr:hypothetical protein [Clostridia bacterium]